MEILVCVALVLSVSEAWGQERGNKTDEKVNVSALAARVNVVKSASFRLGQDVNLTCGDKSWMKDNMMYIIWTLDLKDKKCKIDCNSDGRNGNNCLDHKSLRNSTEGQPILHIPHFTYSDVGTYSCEAAYSGGIKNCIYYVNITAPPNVSSWIEARGDGRMAVCRAERGSPAANISWTFTDNVTMETERDSDGLISVQSSVEVRADVDPQNLSCIVTHLYWDKPLVIEPKLRRSQSTKHNRSLVYITVAISVVVCLALLFWGIKKLHNLRRCQKSSSKSLPDEYVEEVEPYESYVQRVNSIYNSSRDLFA